MGRGGTQPESTVSLAISSIDAVKRKITQELIQYVETWT